MPKYLLLKHYRGGSEPHRPVPPCPRWRSGRGRLGGPRGGFEGVRAEIAMVETPDDHGRLELTKLHPVGPGRQPPPANTTGIRHVAFAVDDIDAVVASLRARDAELVGEVERYEDSYRLCYVRGQRGSSSSRGSRSAEGLPPAASRLASVSVVSGTDRLLGRRERPLSGRRPRGADWSYGTADVRRRLRALLRGLLTFPWSVNAQFTAEGRAQPAEREHGERNRGVGAVKAERPSSDHPDLGVDRLP
jgi:hypothetical protein